MSTALIEKILVMNVASLYEPFESPQMDGENSQDIIANLGPTIYNSSLFQDLLDFATTMSGLEVIISANVLLVCARDTSSMEVSTMNN
jgi:hypothetical protein